MTVERYLYEEVDRDIVLVGSSISATLPREHLGPKIYNLSLLGMGPINGLTILSQQNRAPKIVIVETNTIGHSLNGNFTSQFSKGLFHRLKKTFRSLRTGYEPTNILLALLKEYLGGGAKKEPEIADELFNLHLRNSIDHQSSVEPPEELKRNIQMLQRLLTDLQSGGAQLIFFEAPLHPSLVHSLRQRTYRNILRELYPPDRYRRITFERDFQTTDGIHLADQDASYVAEHISRVASSGALRTRLPPDTN